MPIHSANPAVIARVAPYVAAANTIDVVGLPGDAAPSGLRTVFQIRNAQASDSGLSLRINGSSTNISGLRVFISGSVSADTIAAAFQAVGQTNGVVNILVDLPFPKTGVQRRLTVRSFGQISPTQEFHYIFSFLYNDSTTPITSIGISGSVVGSIGVGSEAYTTLV